MNSNSSTTKNRLVFVSSTLLLGVAVAFGQAPQNPAGGGAAAPAAGAAAAAPAGGGGRGGGGRGGGAVTTTAGLNDPDFNLWIPAAAGRPTTDLELTALTKMDEDLEKPMATQAAAMEVMVNAAFSYPVDQRRMQAAQRALSDAELALAFAQVSAVEKLKGQLKTNTPERLQTVLAARNTRGGGGRGGGAAATGATPGGTAAPGSPAGAAGGPAPAGTGRGN